MKPSNLSIYLSIQIAIWTLDETHSSVRSFPLFMRIHEIAFEGKAVSSIIDL